MNSNHIHGLAATIRTSNIPSVAGNVFLGAVVCFATYPQARDAELLATIITLILAGIFLYLSGNFFNDWADRNWDARHRPERALPRALFHPKLYLFLALSCGGLGLAFSATVNRYTLTTSLLLTGCILLYTWLHKRSSAGVILMGICRALLPIMGYCGLASPKLLSSPAWESSRTTLVLASCSLFCHIAGLSLAARGESGNTVNFANAAAAVKRGGGQNALATVARAFCPEPSVTEPCANLTGLDESAHGKDGASLHPEWLLFSAAALFMFIAASHFLSLPSLACAAGLVPYVIWIALCLTLFRKPISVRISRLLAGIPLVDCMLLLPIALVLGSGSWHDPFVLTCVLFPPLVFISGLALQRHTPAT